MALKIIGNPTLEKLYPEEFPNQCAYLKNICPSCGNRYPAGIILDCPTCGAKRPRCQNKHMTNEDACRTHVHGRPYSLYTQIAATLADSSLEEFIEKENYDLTQEFALARIALSGALENGKMTSDELLERLDMFFKIAQRKKKIEEGDVINLSWNDDLVVALKKRWRQTILSLEEVLKTEISNLPLKEEVDLDFTINVILTKVRQQSKLIGNKMTTPSH